VEKEPASKVFQALAFLTVFSILCAGVLYRYYFFEKAGRAASESGK
jgi:hypothetical protein